MYSLNEKAGLNTEKKNMPLRVLKDEYIAMLIEKAVIAPVILPPIMPISSTGRLPNLK